MVGLITALAGGILAVTSTQDKKAAEATATEAGARADDASEVISDLRSSLAAEQARNTELEAQHDGAGGADAPSATTPAPAVAAAGVYHSGSFKLLSRHQADLDVPPDDPQWGTLSTRPGAVNDIEWRPYDDPAVGKPAQSDDHFLQMSYTRPSEKDCRTATGYTQDEISLDSVRVGAYFCWLTDENRCAVIRIDAMASDLSTATVAATVFKKSGD